MLCYQKSLLIVCLPSQLTVRADQTATVLTDAPDHVARMGSVSAKSVRSAVSLKDWNTFSVVPLATNGIVYSCLKYYIVGLYRIS